MKGYMIDGGARVQIARTAQGHTHAVSVITSEDQAEQFRRTMRRQNARFRKWTQ